MKLNKKDLKNGYTEYDKLERHMKMLHDREEAKRRNWKGKRSKKSSQKSRKYDVVQAGNLHLFEGAEVSQTRMPGPAESSEVEEKTDHIFQNLRAVEETVNVDLKGAARKWMESCPECDTVSQGCLVVVSGDADFSELLQEARSNRILAVSVTPYETQSAALVLLLQIPPG